MKIVGINMVADGSTGTIMRQIATCAKEKGHEVRTFSCPSFSRSNPEKYIQYEDHSYFGTPTEHGIHYVLGKYTGLNGHFSFFATKELIGQIDLFQPDIIHLHNLHNWCVNLPMLFGYIKKKNIPVVWTLHDCWVFTGHCPYFDIVQCDKWKSGCCECPQLNVYPETKVDITHLEYKNKKKWFGNISNLTFVTPSGWLKSLVQESFLGSYPVEVINNGIDSAVFTPQASPFRAAYGCENKKIVLGVAFGWGERKGLDVFIDLAGRLPSNYQIVLVGTDDETDKLLPDNVISIHRTQNPQELAGIYSAADVLANPTREENYPTVNMEAISCGTPVVTFNTGGSPEIPDDTCGCVVPKDDIDAIEREIIRICENRPYSVEACLARAKQFDRNDRFDEYVRLYESLGENKV